MAFSFPAFVDRPRRLDPQGRMPLRPDKIYLTAAAAVIATHVFVFAAFTHVAPPPLVSLGSIDAELVPEGDFFEAEAIPETDVPPDDVRPEDARKDETDTAAPAPLAPVRDAPKLPARQESRQAPEKLIREASRKNQQRREVQYGSERRDAQAARRYGMPGGRGAAGSGASQATCLAHVAAAIRQHTPGSTSLGPGSALVTFHINVGGGVSVVSSSGATPAHAALARRIVAASRGPGSCGGAFVSQRVYFD